MKRLIFLASVILLVAACNTAEPQIQQDEAQRIISVLASDDMKGRDAFGEDINKAADFISSEFERIGLKPWNGLSAYKQEFPVYQFVPDSIAIQVDAGTVGAYFATTSSTEIAWTEASGVASAFVGESDTLQRIYSRFRRSRENAILWIHPAHQELFNRYKSFLGNGPFVLTKEGGSSIVFVICDQKPEKFSVTVSTTIKEQSLANVVGYIEGSRTDEFVLFSAHYDHIGIQRPLEGDSIANGANDDASGTTAVIMLADYFSKMRKPERSLLFVAFTAEEYGGFGSRHFSEQLDPETIVAMFNIEMIGKPAADGPNSAWITGFDKSDFGSILQKAVEGSEYKFYADPYPSQNLFYRSDNQTLARLGVPAHSISTTPIDVDQDYHRVTDEVETLDLAHMINTIKAISAGATTIISGEATPTRIELNNEN